MALHFRIDSVTKTPGEWHINLSIIDDTAPSAILDAFNIEVNPESPASVTAAKAVARAHWQAVGKLITDRENTRGAIQTQLTSIEQGG